MKPFELKEEKNKNIIIDIVNGQQMDVSRIDSERENAFQNQFHS